LYGSYQTPRSSERENICREVIEEKVLYEKSLAKKADPEFS
jgi:hypothetical protein